MTAPDRDEDRLREQIARVVFDEGWTFDGEHGTGAHARHMADVVLAAIRPLVDENTALRAEVAFAQGIAAQRGAERDALRVRLEAVEGGMEQVGWLQDADTDDPAPVKMSQGSEFYAGDVGVCVPLYRLSDAARAALSPQQETP